MSPTDLASARHSYHLFPGTASSSRVGKLIPTKKKYRFVDSTMNPVCHNLRSYANNVFAGLANDGKGTMRWCYGFKLYFVCNVNRTEVFLRHTVKKKTCRIHTS